MAEHSDWSHRANFQLILDRSATPDMFRFCYGSNTNLSKLELNDVKAGWEDANGLQGANVPIDSGFRTGNRCLLPCVDPICCLGNASKTVDGGPGADVNFADVTAVLNNFDQPAQPTGTSVGDADCNGFINFADVTNVLANFLEDCG